MRRTAGQLVCFGAIGALGTGAYLLGFVLLRPLGPQAANVASRVVVALPTSWLNARLTFSSRIALRRAYAAGLSGLVLGAAIGAAVLRALHDLDPGAPRATVLVALGVAQVGAAASRFALLRRVTLAADAQEAPSDGAAARPTLASAMPHTHDRPVRHLPRLVRAPAPLVELLLFATHPRLVAEADAAGIDGVIVDWERRGKHRRQAGEGTQINHDTLADLVAVRAMTTRPVICRIDGFGAHTRRQVEDAIAAGADELLLPMVRTTREVDRTVELVAGRCGLGILVETQDAVGCAEELAQRPLSRIYVGLNDLRIDRGSRSLFAPLVDGTVDAVRAAAAGIPFGVAGLTLPERGAPVPSRLLAAELIRLQAGFTFLRRSFLADTVGAGRPLTPAVAAIRAELQADHTAPESRRRADRAALCSAIPADLVAA